MSDIAIRVENISKRYTIGKTSSGSLRETIAGLFSKNGSDTTEEFYALRDVSFEVKRGEAIGIIGKNGAGKSTLLKVLSRITEPTTGRIEIDGRVSSLLEVGTGFHPELTGRENVFLNGTILGMSRAEVKRKFDEIVDFSGVEKFLDTPVKRYSSGMTVRLAFAVAAHLEPEILIIDEVLAVGDAEFQKKCLGKMQDVAGEGRTVLFVSHNMGAVERLCTEGVLLQNGTMTSYGKVRDIIKLYSTIQTVTPNNLQHRTDRLGDCKVIFTDVEFFNEYHHPIQQIMSGRDMTVRLYYQAKNNEIYSNCRVSLEIESRGNVLLRLSTEMVNDEPLMLEKRGYIDFYIPDLPLSKNRYYLNLFLMTNGVIQDYIEHASEIDVEDGNFYGFGKDYPPNQEGNTVMIPFSWHAKSAVSSRVDTGM